MCKWLVTATMVNEADGDYSRAYETEPEAQAGAASLAGNDDYQGVEIWELRYKVQAHRKVNMVAPNGRVLEYIPEEGGTNESE